jgi:hypothetical protein
MFDPSVWGTVGDWVTALGTTSAFLATFYVIRRDAEERRKSQAKKTSLYVVTRDRLPEEMEGKHKRWYDLTFKNLSEEPIYDVDFMMTDGKRLIDTLGGEEIVLPDGIVEHRSGYSDVTFGSVDVIFRDNSGNNWRRNVKGILTEHKEISMLVRRKFSDEILKGLIRPTLKRGVKRKA